MFYAPLSCDFFFISLNIPSILYTIEKIFFLQICQAASYFILKNILGKVNTISLDKKIYLYYHILCNMGSVTAKSDLFKIKNIHNKEEIIMAYVISDACISCGSCATQCPVSAISQGDSQYEIDANTCIDCGSCASQCPVSAISQG